MSSSKRSKYGFWVLIGILAASGVALAFIVVFGLFESAAYSLVWRVLVGDMYLIASLAAQHTWLRWTIWPGTAVTFVLGIINTFWPSDPWSRGLTSYTVGDPSTGWNPWYGFMDDLEAASHVIVASLVVLGFVSLAYRWVKGERVLYAIYAFTFVAGLLAAFLGVILILDTPYRWGIDDGLQQVQAGAVILALTAAAIVTIAAFVQRKTIFSKQTAEKAVQTQAVLAAGAAQSPQMAGTAEAHGSMHSQPGATHGVSGLAAGAGAAMSEEELRALVRKEVDEYLRERGL